MAKEKTTKISSKSGATRKPSPYNMYMKSELPKVKADNPGLDHKQAFKMAAARWKDSPENPKNQVAAK
ncbi:7216_t:CDS:2 [Ambispora gerdemannii]|uniref:7216_t:CDS:1 n=1 Tax=Ambispora gerdemannii TaxID=144530 RepID=A0A9N9FMI1_9GLOM|nr:7216_t:CDS:2 [Ambispora gerdemannii]